MKFSELQLHPKLQANLDQIQFIECTKIQEQAIPWIRKGKDVAGLAQTGTGKTGAFLIPIIDRILKSVSPQELTVETETEPFPEWKKRQYVLVLVPTRELAEQVEENAKKFLAGTGMTSVAVYGGTSYDKQTAAMKNGVEFVIATPGRLIDLYKEHIVDLGLVRAIVFDEADRMFDMGFKDDMKFILRRVPKDRQFTVFSATLNFDVLNTAYEFGADPFEINISRDQAKAENVKDNIFHVGSDEKPQYLLSLLKKHNPRQTIIFSNFKHNVERISKFLNANGIPAVGISSLLTQAQRNRVMEQFKGENDRNIMVATDLAARGLDILGVDMVVNFELPDDPENYVHRIGRTGRAGATGTALSLVSDRDVDALQRIEDYLKHKVDALWLDDAEIVKEFQPFPRDEGRFGKGPGFRDRMNGGGGDRGPRREGRGGGGGGGRDRGGRDRGRGGRDRGRDRDRGGRGRDRDFRGPRPEHMTDIEREQHQMHLAQQGEGAVTAAAGREMGGAEGQTPQQQPPRHQHRDRHRGRHRGGRDRHHGGEARENREGGGEGQPQQHGRGRHGGGGGRHGGGRSEGRHGGGGGQHREQREGGRHGGSRHGGGGHGQRHHGGRHGGGGSHRPQGASPMAASGNAGLGAKVTGFFKKLFGGKE